MSSRKRGRSTDGDEDVIVDLLQDVSAALRSHASKDVFTIGGSIDLNTFHTPSTVDQGPIVLRWDSIKGSVGKVSLPLKNDDVSNDAFETLLRDCQPATFGKGREEVLDESYRKAGKMDVTKFCTNFNLAEHSIMDTVTQVLVHSGQSDHKHNGIRAELYKLNVGCLHEYVEPVADDRNRFTPARLESSSLTSTPRDHNIRWAPSSSACLTLIKVRASASHTGSSNLHLE